MFHQKNNIESLHKPNAFIPESFPKLPSCYFTTKLSKSTKPQNPKPATKPDST